MLRMKLLVVVSLIIAATSSENNCSITRWKDALTCSKLELKTDDSLNLSVSVPTLHIVNATGSIGVKTFAQMTQLKGLTIEYSEITSVEDGALCSLPNLEYLSIRFNTEFPSLTKALFKNCEKIKELYIEAETLEATLFESFPNLKVLHLSKLSVSRFTKEYLEPLKHLEVLDLSHCKFEEIDAGAICLSPKLKALSMESNEIPSTFSKTWFQNCDNVEIFDFSYLVKRYEIPEDVFSGFVNLKYLVIVNFDIGNFSKGHLKGLSKLEKFYIERCNIRTIDEDAFEGSVNLEVVSLIFSDITEMSLTVFASLPNLKRLILSNNKITSIDQLKNSSVEELNVTTNLISTVDGDAVKANLPNLRNLNLLSNKVSNEHGEILRKQLKGVTVYWA